MTMLRAAAITILFFSSPALAANWKWASSGADGTVAYLDISSVQAGQYGSKKFWIKWDYSKVPTEKLRSAISLTHVKCAEKLQGVQSMVEYKADGTPGRSWNVQEFQINFAPIVPDSMMEAIAGAVCGNSIVP